MPLGRIGGKAWSAFRSRYWAWLGVAALALAFGFALRQSSSENDFYSRWGVDPNNLPYRSEVDARTAVELGQARAAASGKMLMVTFGANWCPDCLTLAKNLRDPATRAYAEHKFEMVHIDVGDSTKTARVERDLGIAVNGIPLAVFYSADGRPICDTQGGELEPSRHYTSREILEFLREVADYRRVVSPDQRQ
jgi:thiol:disulfide interchange protein